MADTESAEANKRFRSPPYPAIPLGKAIERAKQLYGKALHHPVGVSVLADSWKYGAKSSGLWATAAALIQYGLLKDEGSGDKRKFTLTDGALRVVRDPNPESEKRLKIIKQCAIAPKIFYELWLSFGNAQSLSDIVFKSHLTVDRSDHGLAPYSDAAADDVIKVYKETIAFAKLDDSDTVPSTEEDKDEVENDLDPSLSGGEPVALADKPPQFTPPAKSDGKVKIMEGERELTAGLLAKGASFRLIVSGAIGVKEVDRLIQKLQIDKEILADQDDGPDDDDIVDANQRDRYGNSK